MKKIYELLVRFFQVSTPARVLFKYYIILIAIGTIILMTPFVSNDGSSFNAIDSLFTTTSAVSVTGLIVVNTPEYFNFLGQLVILILIQLGGMGITTVKVGLYILLRKKINIKDREMVMGEHQKNSISGIAKYVKNIIGVVLIIELIGFIALALRFYTYYDMGLFESLWNGLFHAVSAINNAGFDVTGNSLIPFVHDQYIQIIFIFLIIFGGIGFPVIIEVEQYIRNKIQKKNFRFSLFSKITVTTYFSVTLIGLFLIIVSELGNPATLANAEYTFFDKFFIALYQTVTTRNAGFSTVEIASFKDTSTFIMTILMFIGASPSSTGGGIRTVTLAVLLLHAYQKAVGYDNVQAFKRTIPNNLVQKAFVTFLIALILIVSSSLAIAVVDNISIQSSIFEVASAFGTTGLSLGITSELSYFSKIIITIIMFIGQIGVSTTVLIFITRRRKSRSYKYAEEGVLIG